MFVIGSSPMSWSKAECCFSEKYIIDKIVPERKEIWREINFWVFLKSEINVWMSCCFCFSWNVLMGHQGFCWVQNVVQTLWGPSLSHRLHPLSCLQPRWLLDILRRAARTAAHRLTRVRTRRAANPPLQPCRVWPCQPACPAPARSTSLID